MTALAIREPRLVDDKKDRDPALKSFRKQWGDPPVVVVFQAVKNA